jgi:2-hydroxy-6-oxonona-2,4-dienedioate hydrolase
MPVGQNSALHKEGPAVGWAAFSAGLAVLTVASASIFAPYRKELGRARSAALQGGSLVDTDRGLIECGVAGCGAPLLSIHGAGGGFDQGLAMAAALVGEGFHVIAPSRFGYLRTPVPRDPSLPAQADAHASLLGALNVSSAIVLGISAGARSAVELALRRPDLVDALVLVVPAIYCRSGPASADSSPGGRLALSLVNAGGDFAWWTVEKLKFSALVRLAGVPPKLFVGAPLSERERVMRLIRNVQPLSLRVAGLRLDAAVDLHELPLEQIKAPTLIVLAEDDLYGTAAAARFAAARIPDVRLIVYKEGGHLLVGQAADTRTSIRDFLVQLGLARPDIPAPARLRGFAKTAKAERRARAMQGNLPGKP